MLSLVRTPCVCVLTDVVRQQSVLTDVVRQQTVLTDLVRTACVC